MWRRCALRKVTWKGIRVSDMVQFVEEGMQRTWTASPPSAREHPMSIPMIVVRPVPKEVLFHQIQFPIRSMLALMPTSLSARRPAPGARSGPGLATAARPRAAPPRPSLSLEHLAHGIDLCSSVYRFFIGPISISS
jgi:hypothetical protein